MDAENICCGSRTNFDENIEPFCSFFLQVFHVAAAVRGKLRVLSVLVLAPWARFIAQRILNRPCRVRQIRQKVLGYGEHWLENQILPKVLADSEVIKWQALRASSSPHPTFLPLLLFPPILQSTFEMAVHQ